MFLSIARVIKFSLQDIFRNVWLSVVTIIILILALFSINMILVVKVVGDTAVNAIKEKIDINLFVKSTATEEEIMALKNQISTISEVKEITYISKGQALENFRAKHEENPEILEALKEIGKNPLTPSLVIKPKNLNSFDDLINKLNIIDNDIIESKNFANYKLMLNKINNITEKVSEAGIALSSIFVLITILVIYNTVRVAIYTHRREITIMRLVGASKWFVQMPYLLSSVIYTLVGVIAIMAIYYVFLSILQPYLEVFFVGYNIDILNYFYSNTLKIFGIQFLIASLINVIASFLAVRKYSNV